MLCCVQRTPNWHLYILYLYYVYMLHRAMNLAYLVVNLQVFEEIMMQLLGKYLIITGSSESVNNLFHWE